MEPDNERRVRGALSGKAARASQDGEGAKSTWRERGAVHHGAVEASQARGYLGTIVEAVCASIRALRNARGQAMEIPQFWHRPQHLPRFPSCRDTRGLDARRGQFPYFRT